MSKKITSQLKALDRSRRKMLEITQQYSHEQLAFRPGDDKWSILDAINHLVMAEKGTHHFMANKRDPERMPKELGWSHPLRVLAMRIVLRSPFKFKMPAKVSSPTTDKSLDQLTAEWQEISVELSTFADSLRDASPKMPVFIHPFFGYFSIVSTLRFLHEHIEHHIKQVKRIIAAKDFPEK
ncbi:MAG: DinB family protein [bacterium]